MIAVVDTTPRRNAPEFGHGTKEGYDEMHDWLIGICSAQIQADHDGDLDGYDFFLSWYKAISE